MLRAKVNIETAHRTYKPGEIIKEQLSDADMAFLKKHNFIVTDAEDEFADDSADDADDDGFVNPDDTTGITDPASDDDSDGGIVYKDESAIKKMNKDEIVEYAANIGLELSTESMKNDLIDAVMNRIEELTAE